MLKKTILLVLGILIISMTDMKAQDYAFGVKGGFTLGLQKWNTSFSSREPLYRYHGYLFIESAQEEEPWALFAQGGYNIKGSALRFRRQTFTDPNGVTRNFGGLTIPFEFRNLTLTLGAKQKFDLGLSDTKWYYSFGIRGDYTISTKLRPDGVDETDPYAIYYPFDGFVNKFNYGVSVGGGLQLPFSELIGMVIEVTVNPDFSKQYNQPRIDNVINPSPWASEPTTTIGERAISNTTFELTLGFRFLHKYIIID